MSSLRSSVSEDRQFDTFSSNASSPPISHAQSEVGSTGASSDVFDVAMLGSDEDKDDNKISKPVVDIDADVDTETQRRLTRLKFVLEKSAVYSSILKERMEQDMERQREARKKKADATSDQSTLKESSNTMVGKNKGRKRARESGNEASADIPGKRKKGVNGKALPVNEDKEIKKGDTEDADEEPVFEQPKLITGAKLKKYQLEGLQWMVSLDQNGISGILADEMGLGKTLQTIAFSAYLREQHHEKPFMVVCPLSVLHNWADEYKRFAPTIPVCIYHGNPEHRAELRRTVMALPGSRTSAPKTKSKAKKKPAKTKQGKQTKLNFGVKDKKKVKIDTKSSVNVRRSGRTKKPANRVIEVESSDENQEDEDQEDRNDEYKGSDQEDQEDEVEDEVLLPVPMDDPSFPVVLTTYEMIIKDRKPLSRYDWGYIVVDEGHRLKNLNCQLMREIKKYTSAGRMILTGTPLHNNLGELWSLLNFILPDIFDDIDAFQEWFNLPTLQSTLPTDESSALISALHAILKPFLLRRLKVDVEQNLPPKKEYVLYAPLTVGQRVAYGKVLKGGLRGWLTGETTSDKIKDEKDERDEDIEGAGDDENRRSRRRVVKRSYVVDDDDDAYFEMLERREDREELEKEKQRQVEREAQKVGAEYMRREKVKKINNMRLQNTVMQLRKVCAHPFLFGWPDELGLSSTPVQGEELADAIVTASGKMMLLDRLLRELFARGHKVLLFSQFTAMLDIIEEWATECMGWDICRIDGSTDGLTRRTQVQRFQDPASNSPKLFLLSTRAGGLGLNLVAADTVIFYDQDWNPQMDAQAQDRAHRIGQTRPVLVFRLISAHTIETEIMKRAGAKRRLEAVVIAEGKFKKPAAGASTTNTNAKESHKETMAALAAALMKLEGEQIEVVPETRAGARAVLSDREMDMLLDRSESVFKRGKGWSVNASGGQGVDGTKRSGVLGGEGEGGERTAFEVFGGMDDGGELVGNIS